MLFRVVDEYRLEVWTTGRQDHLVCFQVLSLNGQRDIGEGFRMQQLIEY